MANWKRWLIYRAIGLRDLLAKHPDVEVYVAAIDDSLTEVLYYRFYLFFLYHE